MSVRHINRVVKGVPTSDGAGVRLKRSLGQSPLARLDPFLMLDEFNTERTDDYIAGFPPHPHRGFETVTYMLDGCMLHEDHLGNRGLLAPGDVQWMTAGRGIIHSEMPQQEAGRMHGFQLWINLPAKEKMKEPSYRDIQAVDIPQLAFAGGTVRVIAGALEYMGRRTEGAVTGISTQPVYFDIRLDAGGTFEAPIPAGHNAFIYVYAGSVSTAGMAAGATDALSAGNAGLLSDGDEVRITAVNGPARFLLLAAKPLHEPVVQYGPFVMNSQAEIEQAVRDYREGTLATTPAARA